MNAVFTCVAAALLSWQGASSSDDSVHATRTGELKIFITDVTTATPTVGGGASIELTPGTVLSASAGDNGFTATIEGLQYTIPGTDVSTSWSMQHDGTLCFNMDFSDALHRNLIELTGRDDAAHAGDCMDVRPLVKLDAALCLDIRKLMIVLPDVAGHQKMVVPKQRLTLPKVDVDLRLAAPVPLHAWCSDPDLDPPLDIVTYSNMLAYDEACNDCFDPYHDLAAQGRVLNDDLSDSILDCLWACEQNRMIEHARPDDVLSLYIETTDRSAAVSINLPEDVSLELELSRLDANWLLVEGTWHAFEFGQVPLPAEHYNFAWRTWVQNVLRYHLASGADTSRVVFTTRWANRFGYDESHVDNELGDFHVEILRRRSNLRALENHMNEDYWLWTPAEPASFTRTLDQP